MKPYLLMLLLAIPALITSILDSERADCADVPAVKTSGNCTEVVITPAVTPAVTPPPPAAKPKPSRRSPAGVKAWFIM